VASMTFKENLESHVRGDAVLLVKVHSFHHFVAPVV
jgi:hypothetical protein